MRLPASITLATCLGIFAVGGVCATPENAINGNWDRDDGLGGVKIGRCGTALCGHVIWLKNKNGPSHIGERVFFDMYPAGDGTWRGRAHNPEDGKDYAGTLTVAGNHLVTTGCVLGGLICKSLGLSRAR